MKGKLFSLLSVAFSIALGAVRFADGDGGGAGTQQATPESNPFPYEDQLRTFVMDEIEASADAADITNEDKEPGGSLYSIGTNVVNKLNDFWGEKGVTPQQLSGLLGQPEVIDDEIADENHGEQAQA